MAIEDDINIDINGNIRWNGAAAQTYTVLALHRYIGALMDDAQASGDDLLDITSDTASDRSTDQIINLNAGFTIDDTLAEHLFDGSVSQDGGNTLYSGLSVVGAVETGTEIMIVQDDEVLPAYWATGINSDAANLIIMKILVKSRSGGADIDGKRIKLLARELGDQYREFPVTLGLANSVGAISNQADLNNATTPESTIEGWTIVNTEGFIELDLDGLGATGQEFYSRWDGGTQSTNDVYEYTKWISQKSHSADLNTADTGTNFVVDDATIVGQGQEFTANGQAEKLTEMRFRLKVGAGTPVGELVAELIDSDDASPALPTGAVLATSEPVLISRVNATYAEFIFRFNDNVTLTASQTYFAVIRNVAADASNTVHVEGLATSGTHAGNRAQDNTGTWAGIAADDLWFHAKTSPLIHGIAGEKFRGIDLEVLYDTEVGGPFTEDEIVFFGTDITYDTLVGGPFTEGEYVTFDIAGVIHNGGKILRDNGSVQMMVALEDITGNLTDGDIMTGLDSGATAVIDTTIVDQNRDGGEGILLALDDNSPTGELYLQLISGKAPVDNLPLEGRSSGATALVATTVNTRVISPEFVGQSTGVNVIGAYGIGFLPSEVGSSDKFTSLDNALRTPPNNVTATVTGLVSGEDYVLWGPRAGGVLDKSQMTLNTDLLGAGETAIVATAAIPSETPAQGNASNTKLRVQLDTGIYRKQAYDSFAGSTFAIPSTSYTGANNASQPRDMFIGYIDTLCDATSEAFTAVYTGDRDMLLRVRDGGASPIKTIENPITFGSSSFSTAIVRQSDA